MRNSSQTRVQAKVNLFKPLVCLTVAGLFVGAFSSAASAASVDGKQDNTSGVALFSAGGGIDDPTHSPSNLAEVCDGVAGANPTDDIILTAISAGALEFIGDEAAEVVNFSVGTATEVPDEIYLDAPTMEKVTEGLTTIDDFGNISNGGDDAANFDMGNGGSITLQLNGKAIFRDGVSSTGTLKDTGTPFSNLDGYEIFIFEDAELSGMEIVLTGPTQSKSISIDDFQVNPNTAAGADDTLIAIDLDTLEGWTDPFVYDLKITDNSSSFPPTYSCKFGGLVDVSLELDAVATRSDVIKLIPPTISIVKTAADAANDSTLTLDSAGDVVFTYVVTNTSVEDVLQSNYLADVVITDDAGTPGVESDDVKITSAECSGLALIAPQDSVTCTATLTVSGTMTNIAVTTGNPVDKDGNPIDTDAPTASDDAKVVVTEEAQAVIEEVEPEAPTTIEEPTTGSDPEATPEEVVTEDKEVLAVTGSNGNQIMVIGLFTSILGLGILAISKFGKKFRKIS